MFHYSTTTDLLARIEEQQAVIDELSVSHLGILSPAAIRRALRLMDGPADLICLDFRKLHDWDELLGWDVATHYFGRFVRTRQIDAIRSPERRVTPAHQDTRGQWGGDEIVIATAPGDGQGLLMRFVQALDELTQELTPDQRRSMIERTGGLIDGFAAAFVLIQSSSCPLQDADRGIAECGRLKSGPVTGNRSTSGRPGTIIGSLPPTCPDCDVPHHIQSCPKIRAALFATEPAATVYDTSEIVRLWANNRALLTAKLRRLTPAQLDTQAGAFTAWLNSQTQTNLSVRAVLFVWREMLAGWSPEPEDLAMREAG